MAGVISGTINQYNVLPAGSNTVFTGQPGWRANITGITFNNPAAQTITVSVYKASNSLTVDIYTFNLAGGDVVADNNTYNLTENDELIVTTSQPDTNFVMVGTWYKL